MHRRHNLRDQLADGSVGVVGGGLQFGANNRAGDSPFLLRVLGSILGGFQLPKIRAGVAMRRAQGVPPRGKRKFRSR